MKKFRAFLLIFFFSVISMGELYSQCSADFKVQGKLCDGSTINFIASDTSKTLTYLWNFGDVLSGFGNTDSVANPSHVFSKNGKFNVTLIVNDTTGCSDTFNFNLTIFAKPTADFTWDNACAKINTLFADSSKAGVGDTLKSWEWNFGNSSTSALRNPQTSYNGSGIYPVKLIILTSGGCTDTLTKNVTVFSKPAARSDLTAVCQNAQVNFVADTLTGAVLYRWDFGDSSFFSVRTGSHVYKKTGYLFPVLTVDFGSTKCTIGVDSILVHALPDASFIALNDTQCFNNNNICVKLSNNGQKLKLRTVIFDDGSFDDFTPLGNSIICHTYNDSNGGKYYLTMELADSNNCLSSYTATAPVFIYPLLRAGFISTGNNGCTQTIINLNNLSNAQPPAVTKFLWDFGDGAKDSINWTNFNHTYTVDGNFNISLRILDKNGCSDTFIDNKPIVNTTYVVDANIDSSRGKCKSDNIFLFNQTPIPGAFIRWDFTPFDSSFSFSTSFHYLSAGKYNPMVTIIKNGCQTVVNLNPLIVYGPTAVFGGIANRYQCQVKDTVYYQNASTLFRNQSAVVFWYSGDAFGSACTTISRQSLNLGMNCNYSMDSLNYKHMFKKGQEACYFTKLVVRDTVIGCMDSVYAAIPLMAPQAKGLFTPSDNTPCPGPEGYKTLRFNLNQSQPSCLKYAWWVMWDSLSASKTGNFDSSWEFNSLGNNFSYGKYAGDSNGNVSMGLIVENGLDTNGKVCRDTGWFHHNINVVKLNPGFTGNYNPKQYYCSNSTLKFFPVDSNQNANNRFIWNFGDGTFVDTSHQGMISHVFTKPGKYFVQLRVAHPGGCTGDTFMWVNIGVNKNFLVSKSLLCAGDSIQIVEFNRYYDTAGSVNYWSDPVRIAAGKELLRFDLDDGNGFRDLGINPTVGYPDPGTYFITMALKDSAGCWDTLQLTNPVNVSGIYANFKLPQDSILCAQTLDLKSLSSTVDSTTMKGLAGDFVKTFEWDFGTTYPKSTVANPRRYFAIGNYTIQHKVTNSAGCRDSISKNLVFIGPKAHFDFIGDTIGCEPLLITFKNTSVDATDYIWQFNDANNSAFGTASDTNISFRYLGHGNFNPQLVARGLFTKNGISQVCDDIYPDTSLSVKRTVTVWELPKPQFTWFTNCANATTTFTNISTISTGNIISEKWYFGDGTSSATPNPTHTYPDTGSYRVVLKVISDRGCEDSLVRIIVISPTPFANFGFNSTCLGSASLFKDSSLAYNDKIYLWRWNFGDGSGSNQKNPSKIFALDTTYSVKLKITNVAGCSDSIIKQVTINSNPLPDFSFANVCDQSVMNFTNNSTSKQTLLSFGWKFGDGALSGSWNTSHVYNGPGNYQVRLKLKTIHGCEDSVEKTVVVHPNPLAKINIDQSDQCYKYHSFLFSDSSTIVSGSTTSLWKLGNMDSSASGSFNYRYTGYGNYQIQLVSVSGFNCRDTTYDSVKVFAMPTVNFSVNQNNQCFRNNLYAFVDLGTIPTGTFTRLWLFGDGNSSVTNPATHTYPDTGIFTARLILTSDMGCKDTASSGVQLWPMPVAGFTINDSVQCLNGNRFDFNNTSTLAWGTISHRWEFGDTIISNGQNVSHTYLKHGVYKVLLIEKSNNNCTDTFTSNVFVEPMPVAGFSIDDSLQCLTGNQFRFTNTSSIEYGNLRYVWRFGDSSSLPLTNPAHVYNNFGTYSVKLDVISGSGCLDSFNSSLEVYPMPVVRAFVNTTNGCINNQQFRFSDSSSIANGNLTRTWKFGDSTTSKVQNPLKGFALAKLYNVWLVELSDFGCSDSALLAIQVYPKPMVSFSVNDSTQCLSGNNFLFTNNTIIQSGSFGNNWRLGDGKTQATFNASNTYAFFGNYKVTLVSSSNFGCVDSSSSQMIVHPMPRAGFTVNNTEQCLRQNQFIFTNNSSISSGSLSHNWRFGDTGVSALPSPTYVYSNFGSYNVWLKSTSNFGCVDSIPEFVIVNPMPVSNFKINDTTQCLNDQNFTFKDSSAIFYGTLTRQWVFDDTTSSALATVNKTFLQDTVHRVKLIQTSDRGCMDSISKMIEVFSKPYPDYTINDTDQCMKQNNFVFINNSAIRKGSMSYQWDFGNSKNSNSANPSHRYFAFGSYVVSLIAVSDNGCIDSLKKTVRVDAMPIVSFTVNDTGQCVNNQSFVFRNNSNIPVGMLQYLWKFGDGNISNVLDPVTQYAKDSTYRVLLTATSNKGCKDSTQKIMDVYPKPKVYFLIDDSIQCLFQNLFSYTNKSVIKYGTLSHLWRFMDGNTATTTDASHSYLAPGNYNVTLRVISDLACADTFAKVITVAPMPKVDFSINDPGQCYRIQNFIFTNRTTLSLGTARSKWHFGDSDTLSSLNANHIYKTTGNYKPKLIATTNYGCRDSLTRNVWVNPNAKASFNTNDSDQCRNQQNYIFTNTSSVSPGQINGLLWNLGNGQFSNLQQVKSFYALSGRYTIILQTTTDSGCIDSFSNNIKVYPKPVARFDINDSAQCLFGNNYVFTDMSFDSLGINQYYWDINNESFADTKSATHVFPAPGYKTVTLIATSVLGCSDTSQRQVYVKPMPDPKFERLKAYYCELTGPYSFVPVTPGGTFYGKNIQSNAYNPVILWEDTVKYVVTLNGCTDSSSQLTEVYPGPVVDLGNDTTLCKFEGLELLVNSWSSRYLWSDGSDRPTLRVLEPGTYKVVVSNICGTVRDSIKVDYRSVNCRFFLPTAFSPNGDGINDRFKPVIFDVGELNYEIFNRWGELLYKGRVNDDGWDGTYRDEPAQEDAYLVYVHYTYTTGVHFIKLEEHGTFILLR